MSLSYDLASIGVNVIRFGPEARGWGPLETPPPESALPLGAAYLAWAAVVLALYPACRAYARLKQRSRHPIWSYL